MFGDKLSGTQLAANISIVSQKYVQYMRMLYQLLKLSVLLLIGNDISLLS